MELAKIYGNAVDIIKNYRYAVIILLIGIVLMVLPTKKNDNKAISDPKEVMEETCDIDTSLEQILSKIEGAGNVQVFLSIAAGEETVYQTDSNQSVSEDNSTTKIDTITITGSDRNQSGLVKQINPPIYQGAVIVCEGADSAAVRLAIVDAVSKVTGLSSNRISVLKMK